MPGPTLHDPDTLYPDPAWVTAARPEPLKMLAFLSGAALATAASCVGPGKGAPSAVARTAGAARSRGLREVFRAI